MPPRGGIVEYLLDRVTVHRVSTSKTGHGRRTDGNRAHDRPLTPSTADTIDHWHYRPLAPSTTGAIDHWHYSRMPRSRSALPMTETELSDIASADTMGLSNIPNVGES